MKLLPDWRRILRRAWSVRLILLAALLAGAEAILPAVSGLFSRRIYAILTFVVVVSALAARFLAQKDSDNEH